MNIFNYLNYKMFTKYCDFNIIFIYSNLFVFRILGLLPWTINFSSLKIHSPSNLDKSVSDSSRKFMNVSMWGLIYTVLFMTCNLISDIYTFQGILKVNATPKMPIVIRTAHQGVILFGIFHVTNMWMLYILRKKTIFHISEQLVNIGRILNSSIKYQWHITPRLVLIFLINIGISLILSVASFAVIDFMLIFTWCTSVVATAWVLIQYALILEIINHQLKMINREIWNLGNISENFKVKNAFISKLPMRSYSTGHIMNLKYAYVHICEVFDSLSDFYAIPMISSLIFYGSLITFMSYFNFYKLYITKNSFNSIRDMFDIIWILIIASAIITLITTVNDVKKEINIIPDNIHWLLNLCSTSGDMENALIEFSNDLLSRRINFTAYDIIPLDGSLLGVVLGTCITYLVILIQFQLR